MVTDLLFLEQDIISSIEESTRQHQTDILLMEKGWNKFSPQIGVGIMSRLDNDETTDSLKNQIALNFEFDGMTVSDITIAPDGKINTYANY